MLDILRVYLVDASTPEFMEVIEDAHKLFDRMFLPYYEDEIVELLQMNSVIDAGDTLLLLDNATRRVQDQLLAEQGIHLHDETTTATKTIILNGMMDLLDYENPQHLLDIMAADGNDLDRFADLISLTSSMEEEDILICIDTVGTNYISTLKDTIISRAENVPDEEEVIFKAALVAKYKEFMHFTGGKSLLMSEMIYRGIDIGFPLKVYVDQVGRDFDAMSIDDAAINLVAMAFASCDGNTNPQGAIKRHMDDLIADPSKINRIDIQIAEILLRFNNNG